MSKAQILYNAPSARFERATFTTGIHRPEITKLSRTITEATLCLAEIRGKIFSNSQDCRNTACCSYIQILPPTVSCRLSGF